MFPSIPKKQLDYLATAEVLEVYMESLWRVAILQNLYEIMDIEAYLSISLSFLWDMSFLWSLSLNRQKTKSPKQVEPKGRILTAYFL